MTNRPQLAVDAGLAAIPSMMFLVDKKHATFIVFTHTQTFAEELLYIIGFAFAKRAVDVPGGKKKRNGSAGGHRPNLIPSDLLN